MSLAITDGVLGTGATPAVSYLPGTVTDNDSTPIALAAQAVPAATDKAGPAILSARTYSTTQVEITFSEPVDDTSILGWGFTFSGFTTGAANAPGIAAFTGLTANDNKVLVTLAATIGTAETGSVRATSAGSFRDLPGNTNTQTATVPVTAGISALPQINYVETFDLNNNGYIDALHVTFTTNMKDSTFAGAVTHLTVAGATGLGFSSTTNGDTANDNDVYITFTDNALTTDQAPVLSYDGAGGVTDMSSNVLGAQGPLTAIDRSAGASLRAHHHHDLRRADVLRERQRRLPHRGGLHLLRFFTTPSANGAGIGFDTATTANDTKVVVTLPAAIGIAETGAVKLAGASLVEDLAGNANKQVLPVSVTAAIPVSPTIVRSETVDLNDNGFIDAVHIVFSTNMKDTTIGAGANGFAVVGATGLAFSSTTDSDTANDNDIFITFTDNVLSTSATPNVSYSGAGGVTDMSSNTLGAQAATAALDKTGPAIVSAKTISATSVQITLSENVSDATVTAGDFIFSGFATPGANKGGHRLFNGHRERQPYRGDTARVGGEPGDGEASGLPASAPSRTCWRTGTRRPPPSRSAAGSRQPLSTSPPRPMQPARSETPSTSPSRSRSR